MIYLLNGYCAYGQLTDKGIPLKIRMKHQLKNRENYEYQADCEDMTLGEYLTRSIDVKNQFSTFADAILDMEYEETPDYDSLIDL